MLERVKSLFRSLLIYGVGDVATSLVGLLLLPIFTDYLSPDDYGVITMLLTIEAVTKVIFRWGVDTAFMRLYYDCADQPARQRLASTILFFLIGVNGPIALLSALSAGWLSSHLIGPGQPGVLVSLTIVNIFLAGLFFIPYQVLRIGGKSGQYIALTFSRSAGTIVARLLLVIGAGMGVFGIVLADIIVTVVHAAVLIRWFVPLIRPVFSRGVMKDALRFGLPRIPHSIAQQVIGTADRYVLKAYASLAEVGLYSIGASFGLALKLFLSAFESAWTPFFLNAMREPDAPGIFGKVSTYVVAVLVLLVAGLCVTAPQVVTLATAPSFHEAARVTPWIALGVMCQGLYLIGSIGLVITKRTAYYPVSTGAAAAVSLIANLVLVPRHGMLGAAWANLLAYATLAAVTSVFSWRAYRIDYEWSRLLRIAVAGIVSYIVAVDLVPSAGSAVVDLLVRGVVTVVVYGAGLFLTGFFHAGELRVLAGVRRRVLQRAPLVTPPATEAEGVEMAGEIVSAAPEIRSDAIGADVPSDPSESVRNPGFRDRDR